MTDASYSTIAEDGENAMEPKNLVYSIAFENLNSPCMLMTVDMRVCWSTAGFAFFTVSYLWVFTKCRSWVRMYLFGVGVLEWSWATRLQWQHVECL